MVEATKGCDINQGKYAKHTQVHKIRITNFVDLHFKGHESLSFYEIFTWKQQGGEGDVFS
jgi:hypothetical protein